MANMKFDAYTLATNPNDGIPIIKKQKHCAYVLTYLGVEYFNWGATYVGQAIELLWGFMTTGEFATLDALYINDDTVVFDPQDGSGKTFNIKILSPFTGDYFLHITNATGHHRKNVKMSILILSEAT